MRSFKVQAREKRKKRVRVKIVGTSKKPRLVVFKSLNNIYVQAVDDTASKIIAASSTIDKAVKKNIKRGNSVDAAKVIGKDIADKLKKKKITTAVFDRSGYIYHGKLKALAEGAREAGLKF